MDDLIHEKIEQLISPFLAELDVILVDLKVHQQRNQVAIEVLADKINGGITLDECTRLNRKIAEAIENQNLLAEPYTLEVSSPGLDRPLKTGQDFLRAFGREVRFFLAQPVQNKIEYTGVVNKMEGEEVIIDTTGGTIIIPLKVINKANHII